MFSSRTQWNLSNNRLTEALASHRASGRRLFDLSVSNPTECGFTYDRHAIMRALCSPFAFGYHPDPLGLKTARAAVRDYYAELGERVAIEDLVLTPSTSEAYSFVFRLLCNPGDEVLAPTPSYPLFDFLAEINDVKLKHYPLVYDHGWQIDLHALEQAITPRTRGVIVVHPNNPTGHFTKPSEIARLNELCAAHGMAIIADEVFLDFAWNDSRPASLAANTGALTFTMSGISKISGLPQMKLAWLVVSGAEAEKREALARLEMIADTYLSMNAPIQLAAPVLLDLRRGFQQQLMDRVRRNAAELDSQLAGKNCGRLNVEGGWYAVLHVPATRPDEDLAIELLGKQDVHVHPGHFYDFPSDGYLILSLITPEQDFAEGVRRVLSVF